ncbi:MAG: hypothetical protein ACRC8S_11510 [Fimbriiglobus sp.]
MTALEVIEAYIDDTVRLLPAREREDVAEELRTLLTEQLHARAAEAGNPADEALALEVVRSHGSPNELAARYQLPSAIIDPNDSTHFIRAAILGAAVFLVIGAVSKRLPSPPEKPSEFIIFGSLAWLGFLVLLFRVKRWLRSRSPAKSLWKPHRRDQVSRIGTAIMIPFASAAIAVYIAPRWMFQQLFGEAMDTSWATYTPEFSEQRLPLLVGLLLASLVLQAYVAVQGRWTRFTRRIGIVSNMSLAGMSLGLAVEGNIFQSSLADNGTKDIFTLVALVYVPSVAVMIYNELGRPPTRGE